MAGWRGLLVMVPLLAGFAVKGVLLQPATAPTHVAEGEFDTARALSRLQRILGDQRPHPVDSDGDDAVRGRLIAELKAIGLQPRIQDTTDCSAMPKTRFVSCSHVRNVVATIPSRTAGPQLLLNAHYDSTPTGPGAGDDGLGVAVLLEVGSILKASPPPRPVTLLFNEGEEFGLNGAHAFVADPQARSINSLINIDNRGVTGSPAMYETSDPNAAAVALYAGAAHRPFANSISTDFAKLIPNTTDVVFFKPRGWTLLNYGIIGNETRYHSPGDNIAALDRDSLSEMGSEVLAATHSLAADSNPAAADNGRVVFTDLGGRFLIMMPLVVAATALGLLLAIGFLLAWRSKSLGKPLLSAAAMAVGGIAAAWFGSFTLTLLRAGDFWRAYPLVAYLAVYALMLFGMSLVHSRMGRAISREQFRTAAWLLVLLFGAALSLLLPGATIFFLIAPAIALGGIALWSRFRALGSALVIAAIVLQFVMFAELLSAIEMLLIDGPLWAVAPLGALAALTAIAEVDRNDLRSGLGLTLVASLGFFVAALVMPRASSERPLGFSIDYFRDAESNKASWGIATKQAPLPANFPGRWHKGELPYNGRLRWIADAPLLPTPTPQARVVVETPYGAGRRVRIALATGGGNSIALRFPANAKVTALGLPGAAIPIPAHGEPDKAVLRCTGRSCDGMQIEVLLGDRRSVTAELFSTRFGLPPEGQKLEAARPPNSQPQYAPDSAITRSLSKL
jgi:hypothetical protein